MLDTETTGTRSDAEVIQFAVLHPSRTTVLEACVRPQGDVPAEVTAIHGLIEEMLRDAPSYDVVHRTLEPLLTGKRVMCFNAAFDACLLRHTADDPPRATCAATTFPPGVPRRSQEGV
ncbi:MAG TPA: 3'-5' exonuclease [Chloroflexota bacterium]|nr:3'-5' exonuclease [Chloroflexota bacterium]